jgi:hypothetical protein
MVGSFLDPAQHIVEVEARGLLPLGKFTEGLQELTDKGLRR